MGANQWSCCLPGQLRLALLAAATAGIMTWPVVTDAADDAPPARSAKVAAHPLAAARQHIAARRWPAALQELQRVDARNDADWNNLMGYTLRKQQTPDLAAAEVFYDEALRLDPNHRGALEYSGELHLMKGELGKAEQRLATLTRVCKDCEELRDLQAATARFKKAGNRYVAP